jgi:hypothetical protein
MAIEEPHTSISRRESVELFAIVLGIGAAFVIHFGFGDRPSIESSTPAAKPPLEFDFNRAERTARTRRISAESELRAERKRSTTAPPTPTGFASTPGQSSTGTTPSLQAIPIAPATRQPSSTGKSPSSKRSAPGAGGSPGAQFDDSG